MPDPFGPLTSAARNASNALGLLEPIDNNIPGGSFQIEELAGEKRIITLRGRAMPYPAVEWAGEQRTKITWYPGNPVATQQVLGPAEANTIINGMWKDRFVRGAVNVDASSPQGVGGFTPPAIVSQLPLPDGLSGGDFDTAERLVQLFHGIRRAGTPLKVTWSSEVRFGILRTFTPTYDRIQDVEWEAEFEWSTYDDNVILRSAEVRTPASELFNLLNTALDIISTADDITRSFVAALVTSINNVEELVSEVFDALKVIDTILDAPAAAFGALTSSYNRLERQLTELIRQISDVKWNSTTGAGDVSQQLAGDTQSATTVNSNRTRIASSNQKIQFERNRRSLAKAFQNLRETSEASVNDRLLARNPNTTRIVTVRQDSTLYDLSIQFYGSPDYANFIASVNSLARANVNAGAQLRLPPRPSVAVGNIDVSGSRNKQDCPPTGYDENCRLFSGC